MNAMSESDSRPPQERQPRRSLRPEFRRVRAELARRRRARAARRRAGAAGQPVHRARFPRAVRIAADLAPSRPDGARAARQEQGVLHDRIERPRRQRDGRAPDAAHRSGVPALSLRRVHGRALPQVAGHGSDHGFGAELRGEQGRSGIRRPPQGVGLASRCGCCRRPRRSPRTCRKRSVPRSRSSRRGASRTRCRFRTIRSRSARSAMRRRTMRPRRPRSTPRSGPRTRNCPRRCCSSARTTASASR